MDGHLSPRRRSATPADYYAAGHQAEAARQSSLHSLTEHETPTPEAPAWMRSAVPEAVGAALFEDDERRRDAALDKLRRVVRAHLRSGRDER
jgi:hypothetical protein